MLKKNGILNKVIKFCVVSILATACSSNVKKADIPSTAIPAQEISKLDADINSAVLKNVDVLAKSEFNSAVKWFDDAKSDLENKKSQEQILNDVRTGRGYLEKAYSVSENQEAKAITLFQARQSALTAGAGTHPELRSELKDVDEDVSDKAANLEKVSAETLIKLQNRYINLERDATVLTQLATPKAIFNGAKKDGAAKKTPTTFKKTEVSLKNAESVIGTNVRNPQGYELAVTQAKEQADLLNEVMNTIKQDGKSLTEPTALKIVMQNRQINKLNKNLSLSAKAANESAQAELALQAKNEQLATELDAKASDLSTSKKDLSAAQTELTSTTKNLNTAQASVEIQKAIETARKQFTNDEAEAYQQGNSLLIRLKKVNFATGKAELPESSLPVLAKISEVAKQLKASGIKVEGHTDSTGTAEVNKTISEERANAVATYFKSNGFEKIEVQSAGFGFEKPIATNKSKAGRALNRRVDVIITPEETMTK